MQELSTDRVPVRSVALFLGGLVAGGATYYLTDGLLPPALVMGAALVVIALEDRVGSGAVDR